MQNVDNTMVLFQFASGIGFEAAALREQLGISRLLLALGIVMTSADSCDLGEEWEDLQL